MEPEKVEVVICGGGSAGLTAAIWLARFGIDFRILERRSGPLESGQADGVQCRTVEIFENLGISEDLLKESYHVMEVVFWSPDDNGRISRKNTARDTEVGLSHQPHVILNQARINEMMLQEIIRLRGNGSSGAVYNSQVESVRIEDDDAEYPVEVMALQNGVPHRYKAKYTIGCDGAHSTVRKSLGFNMVGDSSDSVWGVMDVFPITNFPDIRKKAMITSDAGNLMIIPREGDELVRFYFELPGKKPKEVTKHDLIEKVKRIFSPYDVKIASIVWWSAYVIGQRVADHFTKNNRIFLTGDACHTHSPKAGQGMNVSLQDGFNIGWKMAHVLIGRAPREVLETYVLERQQTAQQLIDFDRSFSKLFSTDYRQKSGVTAAQFRDKFVEAGRYTAGMATKYQPSILTSPGIDDGSIASKLTVGTRFPSTPVVRLSDARPMQLNKALRADGRWHILVFCGGKKATVALHQVTPHLQNLVQMLGSTGMPADELVNLTLVVKAERGSLELNELPQVFFPKTGTFSMRNVHGVFVDEQNPYMQGCGHALTTYGIARDRGAIVVLRPDLYIAQICALEDISPTVSLFMSCLNLGRE